MDLIASEAATNEDSVTLANLDLATLDRGTDHGRAQTFKGSQRDTLRTRFDGEVMAVRQRFEGQVRRTGE